VQAEEALRIGLLDRVLPADELLSSVAAYVDELAANISPSVMAVMKSQVYRHLSDPMESALTDTDRITIAHIDHPDAREGAMALSERRAPKFLPLMKGTA
jgi:enoyl-CoA hydratase/carnithine racemase